MPGVVSTVMETKKKFPDATDMLERLVVRMKQNGFQFCMLPALPFNPALRIDNYLLDDDQISLK